MGWGECYLRCADGFCNLVCDCRFGVSTDADKRIHLDLTGASDVGLEFSGSSVRSSIVNSRTEHQPYS